MPGNRRLQTVGDSLLTTRIARLERGNLLIGDRNGRAAMVLFAHEIEFRCRRVALQTWRLQRCVEYLVSWRSRITVPSPRDLQSKKLPAVGVRKGLSIVLDHCLRRDQLQNCALGIVRIGYSIPENPDGFLKLFWIRILNPRVSDFRQVEPRSQSFFAYHKRSSAERVTAR